ncbi:PEP-CTERM sorting domain-containing protein [Sphingomonas sp. MMS24-J13]|uniref:PEP-CTERM sorting domain-containing protein n=1 Tax=Sphingomonas sp. MMS24-J13 TaxID=3238686 RepID=UPI00384B23EB
MEQMEDLSALFLDPPGSAGRLGAPDIELIGMVRTAIVSGGLVLATSLIAVASAATLHIGPFTHKDSARAPSVSIHLDGISSPATAPPSADTPIYPEMLIAQDPGDEAWQRMLAGASGAPHDLPISVTPIGAVKPIGATATLAYRTLDASPPTWGKLSAISGLAAWDPFIVIPGSPTNDLFTKSAETAERVAVAALATSTPGPLTAAADSTPAPALTTTPDPAPSTSPTLPQAVTAPPSPPAVFHAPPPPSPTSPAGTGSSNQPGTPTPPVTPVPEPASWISFIIGFGLIGFTRRRPAAGGLRRDA